MCAVHALLLEGDARQRRPHRRQVQDHAARFLHGHAGRLPLLQCRVQAAIKANRDKFGEKVDIKTTEDEPEEKKAKMDVEEPDEDLAAALALSMEDDSAVKHRELLESCGLDKDFQGRYLCGNQPVRRDAGSIERWGTGNATPSSRYHEDGVEDDATIQDERAVKF